MASIATLLVKIAADPSEMDKGLKKSERTLEDWGKGLNKTGKTLSKMVTGPIAGMAAGVLALQRNTARYSGEVREMAASTGHTTDSVQELNYALGQMGIGQDMVRRLMERNNQRLARAAAGNETFANAYRRLGVEIRDTNGELRDSGKVFDEVLVSLASIESGAERAAVAGDLLGTNAGRKLAGALSEGIGPIDELRQKAHELGIVMDGEALAAADDFGNEMANLQEMVAASGRRIAMDLLPVVRDFIPVAEEIISKVTDWIRGFSDLDKESQLARMRILAVAAAGGPLLLFLSKAAQGLSKVIGLVRVLTVALMKNPWIAAAVAVGVLVERIVSANREIAKMGDLIDSALSISPEGTQEEIETLRDAIIAVNEKIADTRKLHDSMGVAGTEAAKKQITALEEQRDKLADLLTLTNERFTEATRAALAEEKAVQDTTVAYTELAQAVERVRVAAEKPENEIVDPIAIAEARQLKQEYDEFGQAIWQVMNYSLELGPALELPAESVDKVSRSFVGLEMMAGQVFDRLTFGAEKLDSVLKSVVRQLASRSVTTALKMVFGGGPTGVVGFLGSVIGVNDALITSQGDVVKFHPDDDILAMKDFSNLAPAASAQRVVVSGQIRGDAIHLANARGGGRFR